MSKSSIKCIFVLCLMIFTLSGCTTGFSSAPVIDGIYQASNGIYTVKNGDSLYTIAWNFDKDYRKLARMNNLVIPYSLHPGQRLIIKPAKNQKPSILKPSQKKKTQILAKKYTRQSHNKKQLRTNKYIAKEIKLSKVIKWRWPVSGRIINNYSPKTGNNGINIANHSGAPVYAAAPGIVVYRGSGLPGYGKLIIIKHNSEFLSAYAHNRRLLVREGQMVKDGQKIAEIGHTGSTKNMLHFEIRKAGKPVNPLLYLSKRGSGTR